MLANENYFVPGTYELLPMSDVAFLPMSDVTSHAIIDSFRLFAWQVGDIVSLISMPPRCESTWWQGKKSFEVFKSLNFKVKLQ